MKRRLVEGGPSAGLTNVVVRSYTSPRNPRPVEESKDKVPTHEIDGESFLNKSTRTNVTFDSSRRHPFTNAETDMTVPTTRMSIWMPTPPI